MANIELMNIANIEILHEPDEYSGVFYAYYGKTRLGLLSYVYQDDGSVWLSDIWVHKEVDISGSGQSIQTIGKGIGNRLLYAFLEECANKSVNMIFGNVVRTDEEQGFLKDWYMRNGFSIAAPGTAGNSSTNNVPALYQVIRKLSA